jgi:hypothetical protein
MFKFRNVLVRSRDQGCSWSYVCIIAVDGGVGSDGYSEGALGRINSGKHKGRLIAVFRTGRDLYKSWSDDDGGTWVHPRPAEIPGVYIHDTHL